MADTLQTGLSAPWQDAGEGGGSLIQGDEGHHPKFREVG